MRVIQAFAAEYLGVSPRTVQRWLEDGRLESLTLPALERCKAEHVDPPPGAISPAEAAQLLGISEASVKGRVWDGTLPASVRLRRMWLDRQAVLDYDATRWLHKNKGGCRRCTILLPLNEGGHCWLCAYELEHGRSYFYSLDGCRRANSLRARVSWRGWAGR